MAFSKKKNRVCLQAFYAVSHAMSVKRIDKENKKTNIKYNNISEMKKAVAYDQRPFSITSPWELRLLMNADLKGHQKPKAPNIEIFA